MIMENGKLLKIKIYNNYFIIDTIYLKAMSYLARFGDVSTMNLVIAVQYI